MTSNNKAPTLTITLAITPSSYTQAADDQQIPTLTITAKSHATSPITIFTWPTIFNPNLALKRRNFTVVEVLHEDPTTSDLTPSNINLEITKGPKRAGFQHRRGHRDEEYHLTLFPGKSVVAVSRPLDIVKRSLRRDSGNKRLFQAGHRYRFGVSEGETVGLWWWGTCDDVLDDDDDDSAGGLSKQREREERRGGKPINLVAEPVEFTILD